MGKKLNLKILQNQIFSKPIGNLAVSCSAKPSSATFSYAQNPATPTFAGEYPRVNIRTELVKQEDKQKYVKLVAILDKESKKNLEVLLKKGILLNTESNDKTSTLDNLYKILECPRAEGLDTKIVLKETIKTISNPFIINQNFGDIPKAFLDRMIKAANDGVETSNLIAMAKQNIPIEGFDESSITVPNSGACVAASIEFNLAKQMPAEFARFAQELTSPKVAVNKQINLKNLATNTLDAVWLLNSFEIPYEMKDFNVAKLVLAPDKNALIRAQVQNSFKDDTERSLVDVLMQSTFMNVGSQQSYNSLTDSRRGKFNDNDKGLIEFEKTFAESVVEDKNKVSVTYQIVDEDAKLRGYETDLATVKRHILDSLAMGENVIVGYTQTDDKNTVINGHEITIIGSKRGSDGKTIFICNDTDDDKPNPIEYGEDFLLPKIHHAGLPEKVVQNDINYVDNWVSGISAYKEAKQSELGKSPKGA